jgi:hypothetical protein
MQMAALSELFDETVLVVPCSDEHGKPGERHLQGRNLAVCPVGYPRGVGFARKCDMVGWTARNSKALFGTLRWADAVHAPIPGDVGTIGMLLAWAARKPLFVRHCGNWMAQRTLAERLWRWFMERQAGGRNVMMATGGAETSPTVRNSHVQWVFATSLREEEMATLAPQRRAPRPPVLRLVTVGRQESGKGTDIAVKALALLRRQWPSVTLQVLGSGSQLGVLRELAEAAGVGPAVLLRGSVSHEAVMQGLRESDVFTFPTASEGFPKAVLEAMAAGLPVVTSRVSVLPHLVSRGGGIALSDCTPEAVAQALLDIAGDEERYLAASTAARDTAAVYTLEAWQAYLRKAMEEAWQRPLRQA